MSSIKACGFVPSCFGFIDRQNIYNDKYKHGYRETASKERFSTVIPHPESELRCLLGLLVSGFPLVSAFRIPTRVFYLLSGDFVRRGYELAKKDWDLKRQAWSLNPGNTSAPGKISLSLRTIAYSLWELVKNVIKIATYPLALVGLVFASLYGCLVHPSDGMRMVAALEYAWSRSGVVVTTEEGRALYQLSECLAVCMQSERAWEEANIYGSNPSNPSASETLGNIKRLLSNNTAFFRAEQISVNRMLNWVEEWFKTGERHEQVQVNTFQNVLKSLQECQTYRAALVEAQINNNQEMVEEFKTKIQNVKDAIQQSLNLPTKDKSAIEGLKEINELLSEFDEDSGLEKQEIEKWAKAWSGENVRDRYRHLETIVNVKINLEICRKDPLDIETRRLLVDYFKKDRLPPQLPKLAECC